MITLSPRGCPSCGFDHPPITTCAGAWSPWDGRPVIVQSPMFPVSITLSDQDVALVNDHARKADAWRASNRLREQYLNRVNTIREDYRQAFGAEAAAHRITGLTWHRRIGVASSIKDKLPDLGNRTDVKWTHWKTGHLIFTTDQQEQPLDRIDFLFLLVIGEIPSFTAWGWMEGADLYTPHHRRLDRFGAVSRIGYWASRRELDRFPLPDDA